MSAVQTLKLDARQRAMLDEMGVKVWWPMPEAVEATPIVAEAQEVTAEPRPADTREAYVAETPVVPVAPPAHTPAARPAVAQPPVARPAAAAPLAHGAAVLVEAPRRLYAEAGTSGSAQGGWLVVADMPPEADGRHGEPFAGDAGKLLDNMLRALKLHDGKTPVYLMRTHRGVAAGQPGSPRPIAEAFEEHAAALAPGLVLAMGPLAAQSLMQSVDPLGKLRGRAVPLHSVNGVPVVATYHPAYLLRNPADKARAWADLCLAAEQQTPPD